VKKAAYFVPVVDKNIPYLLVLPLSPFLKHPSHVVHPYISMLNIIPEILFLFFRNQKVLKP
jgi:hypothetical protein